VTTPTGDLTLRDGDPSGLTFTRINLPQPVDKNNYLKRLRQERQYGRLVAEHARKTQPDVILSGNTPLDAQSRLQRVARRKEIPFVFWLQDLLGLAATQVLSRKLWLLGRIIGRHYERMEARQLRQSNRVVAISNLFAPVLQAYGLPPDRLFVQENWADLSEIRPGARDNAWSKAQQLGAGVRFVYAGNLGNKQNPTLLLDLARGIADCQGEVVVIAQGAVADQLKETAARERIANLRVLPFQPADELPKVLASADVLVALLDASAGVYCVPSKVQTYLAAGRPILASLPRDNPSFRLIEDSQSGFPVDVNSSHGFAEQAVRLARDAQGREEMGRRARRTAESRFDIAAITSRFEEILLSAR
jgi:glycosyltransferase involved in cell wall biosynthesis